MPIVKLIRRSLLGGLALALAVPAGALAAELSISASKRSVEFGKSVRIHGRLSDDASGNIGKTVELVALPYPYERPEVVASTLTSGSGSYGFRVRPRFNTKYRVREADGEEALSRRRLVIVEARSKTRFRVSRRNFIRARFSFVYGRKLETRLWGRRIYWYFFKGEAKRGRRVAITRTRRVRPGKLRGRAAFQAPKGSYRFFVFWCFDGPRRDNGLGKPGRRPCPTGKRTRRGRPATRAVATSAHPPGESRQLRSD